MHWLAAVPEQVMHDEWQHVLPPRRASPGAQLVHWVLAAPAQSPQSAWQLAQAKAGVRNSCDAQPVHSAAESWLHRAQLGLQHCPLARKR